MLELARDCDQEALERMAQQVHAMHVSWRPDIYKEEEELISGEELFYEIMRKQLYVAKIHGQAVGYVRFAIRSFDWCGVVPRTVMLIEEFCVEEAFRGQGIGTQMVQELRVLAKAFGCTDLQLSVYPQNDAAVSFYQKCGFMIQTIGMQRKV